VIDDVGDLRRAEPEEMMEDDSNGGEASQRVELVETTARGLIVLIEITRHDIGDYSVR
jgi:hypothetical protein